MPIFQLQKQIKEQIILGKEIAIKTEYVWKQNHKEPINVVLGDEWHAGNLSYHLKSRPVWEGLITKDKLKFIIKIYLH